MGVIDPNWKIPTKICTPLGGTFLWEPPPQLTCTHPLQSPRLHLCCVWESPDIQEQHFWHWDGMQCEKGCKKDPVQKHSSAHGPLDPTHPLFSSNLHSCTVGFRIFNILYSPCKKTLHKSACNSYVQKSLHICLPNRCLRLQGKESTINLEHGPNFRKFEKLRDPFLSNSNTYLLSPSQDHLLQL